MLARVFCSGSTLRYIPVHSYVSRVKILSPLAFAHHQCTNNISVRFYARRSARTRVEEVDTKQQQDTEITQQRVADTPWRREQQEQQQQQRSDMEQTTEDSITPEIRRHLSKVYGTLMAGLGIASVGTLVGIFVPGLAIFGAIASLVGVIAIVFLDRSKVTLRQNLLMAVCGLVGISIAPLVAVSSPGVVFAAALGTSAIFGGFTLAALKAKRKSMLMLSGVLFGGLLVVFSCSIAGLVLPLMGVTNPALLSGLFNINLYGGLGLFSLFIAYDTQRTIESYREGDNDHVTPALNLFLDIINIFIRLLQIFGRK